MGFKLIRLDSEEPTKILLKVGTHIIGRGSFLNCDDQRVSRRHAVLKVTESTVLLKSLHQNPCFYNKQELKKTALLPQNKSIPLSNSDHFGLLPDTYWYEIIYCADDNNQSNNSLQIDQDNTLDAETQNGNGNTDLNEETRVLTGYNNSGTQEVRYQAVSDDGSDSEILNLEFDETMEDKVAESQALISNNPVDPTTTPEDLNTSQAPEQSKGDETYCDVTTPGKRSHTPDPSHESKKVKAEPKSLETAHNDQDDNKTAESRNISEIAGSTSPIYEDTNSQNTVNIQQTAMDVSQNPTDMEERAKDSNTQGNVDADPSSVSKNPTDMEEQAKDSNADLGNVDIDPSSPSNALKKEPESPTADVKAETLSPKKEQEDPDMVKPGPSQDQAGTSNDGAAPKPSNQPIRERCIYGASCYRRNPQHKAQFSHPTDSDYGGGARGACPYAASCRRRDPRHWALHEHPPGTSAPGPGGAGGAPGPRPGTRVVERRGQIIYVNAHTVHFHDDHLELEDEDGDSVDFDYEF